ncbi:MAG TPA: hypothetical protein VGM29_03155, partial [Polyangiaceae bacterium]
CSTDPLCNLSFSGNTLPPGCFCNLARPRTAADCSADESLVCMQGSDITQTRYPSTWDATTHVQCACVSLATPTYYNCVSACMAAFPGTTEGWDCKLPSDTTCDDGGVCTATSADVLRQDGIMCGCAVILLK